MEEKTLRRLEYYKILERLAGFAGSPLGQERALELTPSADMEQIRKWQSETTEGREMMRLDPAAELGGWYDVRDQVLQASRGISLEPGDLLSVGRTLTAIRRVKKFFSDRAGRYPLMSEISEALGNFGDLEQRIIASIMPGGEIADAASPVLGQIRRHLAVARGQVKSRLDGFIRSAAYQKYLQDPIVTIRENRYVIPVKLEHRSQVPGIIHDQSASGATLFIEPMAVVEANNEVRRLQAAEKQEIASILFELSRGVAMYSEDLAVSLDALGRMDLIMARARYSQSLDAWEPVMGPDSRLDIKNGRHPLLEGEVVPTTVCLGQDFDTLVITGPNTGGKTVTLKTVGILALMAQSGLHVPAGEGTVMGVFTRVFADIGDEQSIEQSLSTFSSHMTNLVDILNKAGRDSLVLLDELGAGTDPAEGSALAQAILERLHSAGAKTIATTHYSELKNFAYANHRVENSSVEFDPLTLRPTYRLLIGRPGRSNAFEIAARLGLDQSLVRRSREFMSADRVKAEELMDNLERSRQEAERDSEEASRLLGEARIMNERIRRLEEEMGGKRESILAKAREEAGAMVRDCRREAEELIKDLREKLQSHAARDREGGIREIRERLAAMENKNAARARRTKTAPGEIPDRVQPGEEVFIPRFNQKGFVLGAPEDGQVQLQVGIIKVTVPLSDLRRSGTSGSSGGSWGGVEVAGIMASKAREISVNLDLRGMTSDEALAEMEKYLDDAGLAGLPRVYIIHGKGTGALRAAVQRELKTHRRVKSFRFGETGEGGMGCTVVELQQ
ncbi:MAG: recombination and DNA strand exchange inhibitor protein [Peptococcaceae bacterium BRH_c4a]|nr:MAG: recombination and DNA strand exchange inhibitor protein [Peptococcaceae bacterium BRH_c4a]